MGSCFSSPEDKPARPAGAPANAAAGPSTSRTPATQMSNASGAAPATQTSNTSLQPGQAVGDATTAAVPSGPLAGDGGPDTANPMTDNDFTSALNSAPDSAAGANASATAAGTVVGKNGQPARAERDRSYAIDKLIEEDNKKFKKECKILLLGQSMRLIRTIGDPRWTDVGSRLFVAPRRFGRER